jgi:hypothetical protein
MGHDCFLTEAILMVERGRSSSQRAAGHETGFPDTDFLRILPTSGR